MEGRTQAGEMEMEREVALRVGPYLTLFGDGSLHRSPPPFPSIAADGITSKDVTLDQELRLWARIFLPSPSIITTPTRPAVVLYFHGGGLVFGSPRWANFHTFCADMAARSGAIWVSASYRLAPEHRLPTPIDDSFAALLWLCSPQAQLEPWLASADFSNLFIAGESAGGTIVHHVAIRALDKSSGIDDPSRIRGLIFIHPGFISGSTRTQQELECPQDEYMNWDMADACLQLLFPQGSSPREQTDHYLNPISVISDPGATFRYPPRTLVALADQDALHFLGLEYIKALRERGHHVEQIVSHGVGHVFYIAQPESEQAQALMNTIAKFISGTEEEARK